MNAKRPMKAPSSSFIILYKKNTVTFNKHNNGHLFDKCPLLF